MKQLLIFFISLWCMGMHAEEGKGTIEIGDVLCEDGSIMSLIDYIGENFYLVQNPMWNLIR